MENNLEKVCEILLEEVEARQEEKRALISLQIPAEVLLRIMPVWAYGIAKMEEDAHILAKDEEYEETAERQQYALQKMLSTISDGLTQGDPFKTFNLHAKFSEAGLDVPVQFSDEEGEG